MICCSSCDHVATVCTDADHDYALRIDGVKTFEVVDNSRHTGDSCVRVFEKMRQIFFESPW
jgi:hypothetical protein